MDEVAIFNTALTADQVAAQFDAAQKAGAADSTTLTINVTGRNDDPVAEDDFAQAAEAGGELNMTAGVNPAGNVITGIEVAPRDG